MFQKPSPTKNHQHKLNSNRRILFVSLFNKTVDKEFLSTYFSKFGRIMKIKVQKRSQNLSKTNVLIQFRKGKSVGDILRQKKQIQEDIDCYIDRYFAGEDLYNKVNHQCYKKLEVHYLPYNFTDYDLEQVFQVFGKVKFALVDVKNKPKMFQEKKNFILKPMAPINKSHNFAKGNSRSGCVVFFECPDFDTIFGSPRKFIPLPNIFTRKYKRYMDNYRLLYSQHGP